MELVIATTNKGKLKEICELLEGLDIKVKGLSDFPGCPDVVEDGTTFRENALKKARAVARFTGTLTLADDSGLEVDALGGEPGIHSARFAGTGADDMKNNEKLLRLLKDTPDDDRGCRFMCVLALVGPDGLGIREKVITGMVRGRVAHETAGPHGFGYDPLFYYTRAGKTFAEMGPEAKNRVSHRGRALAQLRAYLTAHHTL